MSALAQGMGGLALILSFALLCVQRTGLAACLFGCQALAVAIAAAAQHALPAAALNAIIAMAVPWLLHRQIVAPLPANTAWRPPATLAAAAVLSLLATAAGSLALPLAVLLLALLLAASRPNPILQALGLCGLQQAALLAACGSAGVSPLLTTAVALPVLPVLALTGVWLRTDGAQRT